MSSLVHSDDQGPGIRRVRRGAGFSYVKPDGRTVTAERELRRIRSLAIPPAWTQVWICPTARGHIQATGRDARGRKQYRYHPSWTAVRDANKYARLRDFARALPKLRRRLREDLAARGLPRRKVLATVVQLLEFTLIRVGNGEYARDNGSYGLTTIRDHHVRITPSRLRFRFRGKGGKVHDVSLADRRLARIVRQCQELPGSQLFQYMEDGGRLRTVTSSDVNRYLREVMGTAFTAKDFRTWAGTALAAGTLSALAGRTTHQRERLVVEAMTTVAQTLGNTRAVCRKCYVHPVVIDAYLDGSLQQRLSRVVKRPRGLTALEAAVMSLVRSASRQAA